MARFHILCVHYPVNGHWVALCLQTEQQVRMLASLPGVSRQVELSHKFSKLRGVLLD